MEDPFDLNRFLKAQANSYNQALSELRRGEKRSHWIWFIFPQVSGLGFSSMSEKYGIDSEDEAAAYLEHPVLGPRLLECTRTVVATQNRSIEQIFGSLDAMKFRSSMTLFAHAAPDQPLFAEAITKYFGGQPDERTLKMLS